MPGFRVHLFGGICSFLLITALLKFNGLVLLNLPLNLVICLIASIFPDIDTKSKMQLWFYRLLAVLALILALLKCWSFLIILVPILIFPLIINHRGITHKFWFIGLISLLIYLFLPCLGYLPSVYFLFGALSHILFDKFF